MDRVLTEPKLPRCVPESPSCALCKGSPLSPIFGFAYWLCSLPVIGMSTKREFTPGPWWIGRGWGLPGTIVPPFRRLAVISGQSCTICNGIMVKCERLALPLFFPLIQVGIDRDLNLFLVRGCVEDDVDCMVVSRLERHRVVQKVRYAS